MATPRDHEDLVDEIGKVRSQIKRMGEEDTTFRTAALVAILAELRELNERIASRPT